MATEHQGDHDGKSKSASAADEKHYPAPADSSAPQQTELTHAQIAAKAYKMWLEQGQPSGSAEWNWLEAERQLKAAADSRKLVEKVHEKAGSVQP